MDFLNLPEAEIPKLNKNKLQNCVLDIKNSIASGLTTKDLILNSFEEIKADLKQLHYDIKKMKDGFTPVPSTRTLVVP